jgi:hypothetical protein
VHAAVRRLGHADDRRCGAHLAAPSYTPSPVACCGNTPTVFASDEAAWSMA